MLDQENQDNSIEIELEDAVMSSLEENHAVLKKEVQTPDQVQIFPILRRPFFPGMAAPIVIEPGPFYEVLKVVAKSDHKCVGLLLTRQENIDIYKATFSDLHEIGVLARVLRIIPMEQGGAQVILNMEKRLRVVAPVADSKTLKAHVTYYEDNPILTTELKAYAISIISTIKELLKLNPLFKEELQIFLDILILQNQANWQTLPLH